MKRVLAAALVSLWFSACPAKEGPQGPAGPQGATGEQGPAGPQGPQGEPGQVLVLDGGVVQGPPGASVRVTTLPTGSAACPFGGVQVDVDGGTPAFVCNGAPGEAGMPGAQGPMGLAGASVTMFTVAPGDATCPAGGARFTTDGGSFVYACNGANGAQGATGATGAQGPIGPQGLAGATGATGATGAQGPQGVAGATGAQGPQGLAGATGATGATGAQGPQGVAGATGAQGPQGIAGATGATGAQGPQGVAGSPGATGATGATGAQGPQGVAGATGATGALGPTGAAGMSVVSTALGVGDVNCPYGGARFTVDGGTFTFACNGAPGPMGPPGPAGSGSSDGGTGPSYETFAFIGFTPLSYTGNLGGRVGAHALCASAYPGAHFCSDSEYVKSLSAIGIPAPGAWVDPTDNAYPGGRSAADTCNYWSWTGSQSYSGQTVRTDGFILDSYVSSTNYGCQTARPLACCNGRTLTRFRGFTSATYNGNLGGRVGAHAKCAAEYAGAHFCSDEEYVVSLDALPIPASGAWVDPTDSAYPGGRSAADTCNYWSWTGPQSYSGQMIRPNGFILDSYVSSTNYGCQTLRPLACCE